MNKNFSNIKKGFEIGFGIFLSLTVLFGLVYAVGFHTANEVISGTFIGNYVFNDSVDFTSASVVGITTALNCSTLRGGEWILVPGNDDLGTDDFCVMKFEAKNVNGTPTSQASSTAWVSIIQPTAITTCESLGKGYHLIKNNEWTTIARNAENVSANWDSGVIGTGSMWRGHSDNSPSSALSVSDIGDYYDQTGNSGTSIERRVLTLSNSEVIWDLGGNVWEWNSDICTGADPWYNGASWIDWTNANVNGAEKNMAGPIGAYTSTNGVGQYYGCTSNGNGFLRGGKWNNGASAGAFALYLNDAPLISTSDVGFRCSYSN